MKTVDVKVYDAEGNHTIVAWGLSFVSPLRGCRHPKVMDCDWGAAGITQVTVDCPDCGNRLKLTGMAPSPYRASLAKAV